MRSSTKRMIKALLCSGLTLNLHIFIFFMGNANFYALWKNIRISKFHKLDLLEAFVATPSCCDKLFLSSLYVYSDDSLCYENIILILCVQLLHTKLRLGKFTGGTFDYRNIRVLWRPCSTLCSNNGHLIFRFSYLIWSQKQISIQCSRSIALLGNFSKSIKFHIHLINRYKCRDCYTIDCEGKNDLWKI